MLLCVLLFQRLNFHQPRDNLFKSSSACFASWSWAILKPKPNSALSSNKEFDHAGPLPSLLDVQGVVGKFAAGGKRTSEKNLGLMAISYGYVYVTQISMGANPVHALKAIKEAEAYDGPSLIIAYSHCIAHGINMKDGLKQQELAVASGYWPLYRYNPEKKKQGQNPFSLDSKDPVIPLKEYAYNQTRFKSLKKINLDLANDLMEEAQKDVDNLWNIYKNLAK